jgi:hypothetical protein
MLRRVALVRTDVSKELSASFIRVTRIGELGTTLAVTSSRRSVILAPLSCVLRPARFCSVYSSTLKMDAINISETLVDVTGLQAVTSDIGEL